MLCSSIKDKNGGREKENVAENAIWIQKNKGTSDALHSARRIITMGESSQNRTFLLLSHLEKAFNAISHEGLCIALERLGVEEKLINSVLAVYQYLILHRIRRNKNAIGS